MIENGLFDIGSTKEMYFKFDHNLEDTKYGLFYEISAHTGNENETFYAVLDTGYIATSPTEIRKTITIPAP